jgi:flavin reductase (DIM6/NTAB) family NADH-FMN oxidoreductase RutF
VDKVKLGANAFLYPMPMTLIGATVEGRDNFLAAAWVMRCNYEPPLVAVALGKRHFTSPGIVANGAFSVNVPGRDLLAKADYCGIASGAKVDKSKLFTVIHGEVLGAPMIAECPLAMECRLYKAVDLPVDTLFIGQIVESYSDGRFLTDGKLDVRKMEPFVLTMPDNGYWAIGEYLGKAWSVGNEVSGK